MAQKGRFLAVISVKSGRYREETGELLTQTLARKGWGLDFYYFEELPELRNRITEALQMGCRSYLAVGGDGTVALLASCLTGKDHRLGIIPAGTANTMARILKIPLTVKEAAELAASGPHTRRVDGIEIDGRLFFMNASVGLSSISLNGVNSRQKSFFGMLSYFFGVIRNASKVPHINYKVNIDGRTYTFKAVETFVTNTGVLGTPDYRLSDNSSIDDGKLEVLTMDRLSPVSALEAFLDTTLRRKKRRIRLLSKGEEITIETASPIPVQADGDLLHFTPVTIRVRPRLINFIVP